jgi:CopG antitoxin of type II toxin-antitoxin system
MKQPKQRPHFDSEDQEREFWATHEIEDYFDMSNPQVVTKTNSFPNLKRTEGLVELHIDDASVKQMKTLAKKRKVDLATLAALYVQEGIQRDARYPAY